MHFEQALMKIGAFSLSRNGKLVLCSFDQRVEMFFEGTIYPAQPGHYSDTPLDISESAFDVPISGRVFDHVPYIADLVGEFNDFGSGGQMWGVFDLQLLSACLRKTFVVSDLKNIGANGRPKMQRQFNRACLCIFDRVVEKAGHQDIDIDDHADIGKKIGDLYRVINVRFGIAAFA